MENELEVKDDTGSEENIPRVRHPRPAWQEFILFLSSFTLFVSFWMVGRVRDLKAVGSRDFTPWLWFFVPLILLAQLIAMPRFFDELKKREKPEVDKRWKSLTWLWIAILVVTNILILVEDRLGLSEWSIFMGLLIISFLFALLHSRITSWKEKLVGVEFYGRKSGYYWYEWIMVVIGTILLVAMLYFFVIAPLFVDKVRDLKDLQSIENAELDFKLIISGDDWIEVAGGTHSTDETELELSGPVIDSFFIVFDYGISSTLNSTARNRAEMRDDFSSTPKCEEERYLANDETSVISYTECLGTMLGDRVSTYSTLIKRNDRVIELYGYLMASKHRHKTASGEMQKIAKSFSPL